MDLKEIETYDCQVADFFANRKKMHLTETDIAQILSVIKSHSKQCSNGPEPHSGCKEWIMTISPENELSLTEAASPKNVCQVLDFVGKKATIHEANRKGKDNVNTNISVMKQKRENEMRNHFSVVDQKLRQCIQLKTSSSFWERTIDAFIKVLKKL